MCFLWNILMNCCQFRSNQTRVNTVIISCNRNLIRNHDSFIKKEIYCFYCIVIWRKGQCFCFEKAWEKFSVFPETKISFTRNNYISGMTAESPLFFHRLFESHPPIVIAVQLRFRNKQCFLISTGIQVFSDLIPTWIIIYTNILEGISPFRISIDQNHFLI